MQRVVDLRRHRQRELAVRQRQRLLRHDALGPPVALEHVGVVEDGEELVVVVVRVEEVHARRRLASCWAARHRRPAERRVEVAGQVQQAVADDLGLHPHRVHAPEVAVLRVELRARLGVAADEDDSR